MGVSVTKSRSLGLPSKVNPPSPCVSVCATPDSFLSTFTAVSRSSIKVSKHPSCFPLSAGNIFGIWLNFHLDGRTSFDDAPNVHLMKPTMLPLNIFKLWNLTIGHWQSCWGGWNSRCSVTPKAISWVHLHLARPEKLTYYPLRREIFPKSWHFSYHETSDECSSEIDSCYRSACTGSSKNLKLALIVLWGLVLTDPLNNGIQW